MKRYIIAGVVAAGMIGFATSAYADPITTVPPGGTIVSGDKTFTFGPTACSIITGTGLTCAMITASAHTSTHPPDATNGDPGIRIQGAFNGAPVSEDVTLTYTGTASGGQLFHDASMMFNGTVMTSITEDIFNNANGDKIGHLQVANPPPTDFTDDIVLSENALSITVEKDIQLNFTRPGPTVISIIDQNFSQTPEPASLTLLGTA